MEQIYSLQKLVVILLIYTLGCSNETKFNNISETNLTITTNCTSERGVFNVLIRNRHMNTSYWDDKLFNVSKHLKLVDGGSKMVCSTYPNIVPLVEFINY